MTILIWLGREYLLVVLDSKVDLYSSIPIIVVDLRITKSELGYNSGLASQ